MTRRSKKLTDRECLLQVFQRCGCGYEIGDARVRVAVVHQRDGQEPWASPFYCEGHLPMIRELVHDKDMVNRPTLIVRVIPKPELIALADKMGASIQ